MGKTFSVESFAAMKNTADQLKAHATTYESIYKQLLQVASTISSWGGADQEAFAQKAQGLSSRLQAVASRLSAAGEIINAERLNYVSTQDAVIEGISKLQN